MYPSLSGKGTEGGYPKPSWDQAQGKNEQQKTPFVTKSGTLVIQVSEETSSP